MNANTRLYRLTFDQHHNRGTLRGLCTEASITLDTESAVDRWARAMRKYAVRNGYDVANVRCEVITVAEHLRRFA